MTVIELIQKVAAQLEAAALSYGHGTNNAWDEAAWLVLWRLNLPLDALDEVQDKELTPSQQNTVDTLLHERIKTRKPLAYLTQEAYLQGVAFYVDERTIVPRSLIAEILADGQIDPWLSDQTYRVLDLCTGNGSLAVLAAMAYPDVTVDAADISSDALAVARTNVNKHQLHERITLIESDGLSNCTGPYDLILCNPPYVNADSMANLPPEYRAEPELALGAGPDGMDFIRPLLEQAPRFMSQDAVLVLEIGHERAHFEAAFPHLEPVWLHTSQGSDMVLLLTREMLAL